jgi:flagellin-like protein
MTKGISPLVATVLLIAITMTIAGVLAYWASGFVAVSLPQPECSTASFVILYKNYDPINKNITLFIQNKGPGNLIITNVTFGYAGGAIDTRSINRTLAPNSLTSIVLTDVEPNYIICSVYSNCPNVYASCM